VNLTVADMDRSIAFYTAALGLAVRWSGRTNGGQRAAHLGGERSYVSLFEAAAGGGSAAPDYDRVGFNHLGFVVDDLDAARARLAELGVAPHAEMDYAPGRRLYCEDPDGYEVELVQYASVGEATSVRGEAPARERGGVR
jgi:catechol 2,3-dioxygenase-like lactoylglutathione lyase family enzyme